MARRRRQRLKAKGQRTKGSRTRLSLWQRFKKFAFNFELTPGNIRKALTAKRKPLNAKFLIFFFVLSCAFLYLFLLLFKDVPSPTKLSSGDFPVSTQILDRNGNLLYEIYADQNRTPIKLKDLPPFVLQATI